MAKARHSKRGSKAEASRRAVSEAAKEVPPATPVPVERPAFADLPPGLAAVKQALDLVARDKFTEATAIETSIADPVGRKLIEWALLRRADSGVGLQRYEAFVRINPQWPSIPVIRHRAEAILWRDRADAATARRFFGEKPVSPLGRLVLARVLMGEGDRARAEREVRAVWRSDALSGEAEHAVLSEFPDVVTRADEVARMDRRIGAKDYTAAARAAKRIGGDQVAIVRGCAAAEAKSANGGKLLDAVPAEARDDLGYALCRIHWLLRDDSPGSNLHGRLVTSKADIAAAVKLALTGAQADLRQQDTDEWWRERRLLARKLLDLGDAANAYAVVAAAAPPANEYYRAEAHFMAGWIALRFLNDPQTASRDFARIDDGARDPRILARAAYWRGRAAEAAGNMTEMGAQYDAASRYPTAYYGQLARARLGLHGIVLPSPPRMADPARDEILRAAGILYVIGEHDELLSFVSDLAKESSDAAVLAGLGELAAQHHDARAMLLVGKTALARGMSMDQYAFPDFGIPSYAAVGPALDRCVVYAVARTESAFNQRDKSSANAVGLMQVTPAAGRDTARRFGVSYHWDRLVADPVYNTQMGAAELAALLKEYRGSYILVFAAYNAGRGRVQQWMGLHGDPRDAEIDPVDWVERIPFAETRNYVERVMENLEVYRARFAAPLSAAAGDRKPPPSVRPALVETIAH